MEKSWLGKLIDKYMDPENPAAEKRRIRSDYKKSDAYKENTMGLRDLACSLYKIFKSPRGKREL